MIAFHSRSLSKSERNYCVTRKELVAVVVAVKTYHHYLCGRQFLVRTDHGALKWLLKFRNPEGQLARWLELLLLKWRKIFTIVAFSPYLQFQRFENLACTKNHKHNVQS